MTPTAYMTTSWDDGHPADHRLADLLEANGLRATFYIPRTSQNETMPEADVRALSARFEIGAHTLRHAFLNEVDEKDAKAEIAGSKAWVEDVTGRPCKMFCPPAGKFADRDMSLIREAGYLGIRTVELMSTAAPRPRDGVLVMPTTLQVFPHRPAAYVKNAVKRRSAANLWRYVVHGRMAGWDVMATKLLEGVAARGGVFHLWGHSWELDQIAQWERLGDVLRLMRGFNGRVQSLTNSQVCETVSETSAGYDGRNDRAAASLN